MRTREYAIKQLPNSFWQAFDVEYDEPVSHQHPTYEGAKVDASLYVRAYGISPMFICKPRYYIQTVEC